MRNRRQGCVQQRAHKGGSHRKHRGAAQPIARNGAAARAQLDAQRRQKRILAETITALKMAS